MHHTAGDAAQFARDLQEGMKQREDDKWKTARERGERGAGRGRTCHTSDGQRRAALEVCRIKIAAPARKQVMQKTDG